MHCRLLLVHDALLIPKDFCFWRRGLKRRRTVEDRGTAFLNGDIIKRVDNLQLKVFSRTPVKVEYYDCSRGMANIDLGCTTARRADVGSCRSAIP